MFVASFQVLFMIAKLWWIQIGIMGSTLELGLWVQHYYNNMMRYLQCIYKTIPGTQ